VLEYGLRLFRYQGSGTVAALRSVCSGNPDVSTVALYPAHALFPDVQMGYDMLESHHSTGADVTFSRRYPVGFLPQIFRASMIREFPTLTPPLEAEADMLLLLQTMSGVGDIGDRRFYPIIKEWGDISSQHPRPEELPYQLLLNSDDIHSAAETVLAEYSGSNSASVSEAIALKRQLVRQKSAAFSNTRLQRTPHGPRWQVLFSTDASTFTGGEKIWLDMITHIDTSRFAPYVVVPVRSTLSERLIAAGIPVEVSRLALSHVTPRSLAYIDALFNSGQFDLVHVNGVTNLSLLLKARSLGIPVCFHFHGSHVEPVVEMLELADKIIAVSHAQGREIGRLDIPQGNIAVIHNGVDTHFFSPGETCNGALKAEMNLPDKCRIVCMISRVEQSKNIELMLSALPVVLDKYPDTMLLIAGEVFPSCFGYFHLIQELAGRLGITDHVRYLNFVEDVRSLYAISNVLVLCRDDEPLATCILEALSMGIPVVAPNSWGCSEMITNNEDGLLYRPGDANDLGRALLDIFDDACLTMCIAAQARRKAHSFDLMTFVHKIETLFENMLTPGRATAPLD
jgi:glycosyltransferase involved in cell wall biosynthesis